MGDIPRLEYHVEECPPPFLMGFEPGTGADEQEEKRDFRSASGDDEAGRAMA